jgi:hypothetical protein
MNKKKDSLQVSQSRLDWYQDAINYETNPAEKTAEGFLIARAPVTSIGVFSYRNPDGSERRELRLPEEVFAEESLASLKMKPLTLLHPDEKVTPENVGELSVGSVGSDVTSDSYRVYVSLTATKKDAVDAVENGSARSLSCGYDCDIEWTSGTWMGMKYDCIQRKIRYNHVALVPVPRAGDGNSIRMDSAGTPTLPDMNKHENNMNQEDKMDKIHLDGADYQAEPQVIAAYNKAVDRADGLAKELDKARTDAKEQLDKLTAEKSTVEAERDTFKERLDAMEKEMPGKIENAIKDRLELVGKATAAGVEVKADMADADIKKAVISKVFPSANLDGKDDAYIAARFDCACELSATKSDKKSRKDAADIPSANHELSAQDKLEEAMKRYNARMDSAWKDEPNNNKEA